MFNYLLLLQYPLIYLPMLIIGLVIYGSDFKGLAGGFYLLAVVAVPLLTHWRWSALSRLGRSPAVSLAVVGVLSAFWLYRDLHFAVWDEHAWFQAVLVMVLGFSSSLLSVRAAGNIAHQPEGDGRSLLFALLLVAASWYLALAFPFAPILVLAVLLLWAVYVADFSLRLPADRLPLKDGINRYSLFLAAFLLFLPVWDYRIDSQWALLLALSMGSAAFSSLCVKHIVLPFRVILIGALIVDYFTVLIWPSWVISVVQAIFIGGIVGCLLGLILRSNRLALARVYIPAIVLPLLLGMLCGALFYTNYEHTQWRLLLLLPLIYLVFSTKKSIRHLSHSES